jgi:homoserine kinase
VSGRRRIVRVPASSANLGPGYDVLGAALELELELEVSEEGSFSVHPGELPVSTGRDNLLVRAFERLHPADDIAFRIGGDVPLGRGLGSSASAIVAGLLAADHLYELGNSRETIFRLAAELEGHPDNVAAALFGGIVVCGPAGTTDKQSAPDPIESALGAEPRSDASMPALLAPPEGVEAILVIPGEEVSTEAARAALPAEVPIADAAHNVGAAAQLVLGIERSDLGLIERGLADRLHQPHRASLYPRSMEIVEAAAGLGAIGATISGAGPTVLVWSYWQSSAKVSEGLAPLCDGWAEVRRVPFSARGARVELPG